MSAFTAALNAPVVSHHLGTAGYDLYEAYLFGLTIEAAQNVGLAVRFVNSAGVPVTSLVFRSAPSRIGSSAQPFTHAEFLSGGEVKLEAHLGIFIRSASGVSHEGDVVVVDAGEAARARAMSTDPRSPRVCVVLEAKFYAANIRLAIARQFLGLGTDLGAGPVVFVSSAGGGSAHRMLSYRNRQMHFDLLPGSQQEGELRARIATKIRDYLAKNP